MGVDIGRLEQEAYNHGIEDCRRRIVGIIEKAEYPAKFADTIDDFKARIIREI